MVQIVENLVAGPFETPPFEFYVYRNPGDGETVMGYLSSEGIAQTVVDRPLGNRRRSACRSGMPTCRPSISHGATASKGCG